MRLQKNGADHIIDKQVPDGLACYFWVLFGAGLNGSLEALHMVLLSGESTTAGLQYKQDMAMHAMIIMHARTCRFYVCLIVDFEL